MTTVDTHSSTHSGVDRGDVLREAITMVLYVSVVEIAELAALPEDHFSDGHVTGPVGAAVLVAMISSVPVLVLSDVRAQEFTGDVPAVLIGVVAYLIARSTGKARVASVFYGLTALALGILVALVKLKLAAH